MDPSEQGRISGGRLLEEGGGMAVEEVEVEMGAKMGAP